MGQDITEGNSVEWDARDKWTSQLMYRMHKVLDSSQDSPRDWFENLSDLYDFASAPLGNEEQYMSELEEIDQLIYAIRIKGRVLTDQERKARKIEAYRRMRQLFRQMNKDLFKGGYLVPFSEKRDIHRAIAGYHEK